MSEYTPTTSTVRDSYAPHRAVFLRGKDWYPDREASEEEAAAEFDRWLAERDAALIESLADEWHAENTGTSPRMYAWLRERARLIREGGSSDDHY